MSGSIARTGVVAIGALILILAVAFPSVALVVRAVEGKQAPSGGWGLSMRQLQLLQRSVVLAASAVGVSLLLSLPAAYLIGRGGGQCPPYRRLAGKPLWVALLVSPLLLPPMVYAFGWQRLLNLPGPVQCVWVWSAWAWPIPALVIGSGWSRFGRAGYEAALLVTSPGSAFVRAVLPVLLRYVAASALVLFVLFLGEYSVPHACLLTVYSTELLGLADSHWEQTIEVLWASSPLVAVLGVGLLGAWQLWRRSAAEEDTPASGSATPVSSKLPAAVVMTLVGVTVVLPVMSLAWRPSLVSWMVRAWQTYHAELLQSLGVSIAAGLVAVAMGVGLALSPAGRKPAAAWALLLGILPGALVGEALISAYLHAPLIYDHWPIVILAYVARFGWVGILAGWLATKNVRRDLIAQARTDGADEFVVDTRVRLWPNWPTLACGVCIVAALSLADVTAISLVRVPGIGAISLILIEKFHRFETDMLVSLSLWLVASAIPGAVLLGVALRRRAIARH